MLTAILPVSESSATSPRMSEALSALSDTIDHTGHIVDPIITQCVICPLDRLVASWKRAESANTASVIRRGELLSKYLARELAGLSGAKRRSARGLLIDEAVARLRADGYDINATRLLKSYGVAQVLGESDAATLSASVLAEFGLCVHRLLDSEEYALVGHEAAIMLLWETAVHSRIGRDAVRESLVKILCKPRPAAKKTALAKMAASATKDDVADFIGNLPDDLLDYLTGLLAS